MPRGKRQWVVGAGVGEEFGKVRVFPVLGAVWMLSDRSTLTTLFPLLKYEYSAGNRRKYVAEFAPSGAEWTWEPGAIGNAEAGDLILQGLRISGGGEFGISEAATAFANVGVVVARKAKVAQQANPSNNASVDLKPAWFVEFGISFP
jgi:hypothetical protein